MNKIFCIGFHKTGTTSMAKALKHLGYKVTGPNGNWDRNIARNVYRMAEELIPRHDAFQDIPWFMLYRWCDERYPGSKFILTVRDPQKWYESALKHFADTSTPMREWIYGKGFGAPLGHREHYLEHYHRHYSEVYDYFAGREEDLLEFDVTGGDGWEKLCPFLGREVETVPFPHANPGRPASKRKVPLLKRWKRIVLGR